jgi:hypothetical protein
MTKTKMQEAVRELRMVYHDAIESEIRNSAKSYAQIGLDLGCSEQLVYQVARLRHLSRQVGTRPQSASVAEEENNVNQ